MARRSSTSDGSLCPGLEAGELARPLGGHLGPERADPLVLPAQQVDGPEDQQIGAEMPDHRPEGVAQGVEGMLVAGPRYGWLHVAIQELLQHLDHQLVERLEVRVEGSAGDISLAGHAGHRQLAQAQGAQQVERGQLQRRARAVALALAALAVAGTPQPFGVALALDFAASHRLASSPARSAFPAVAAATQPPAPRR